MEVTDANETPSKDAGRKNFNGTDIKWILKPSADGTYTLGYQDSDAYSTAFVYTQNGTLATSYEEPAASFASGQWFVKQVVSFMLKNGILSVCHSTCQPIRLLLHGVQVQEFWNLQAPLETT